LSRGDTSMSLSDKDGSVLVATGAETSSDNGPSHRMRATMNGASDPAMDQIALARIVRKCLSAEDEQRIRGRVRARDWKRDHMNLANAGHVQFAAQSLADGAGVVYGFSNFYALACHPNIQVVRSMNHAKGRERNQTASVTTIREHISELFDWTNLPHGLDRARVMGMMDAFYSRGPFGFRGPAAPDLPDHLTATDPISGVRTVQLIAPGYRCPSNAFIGTALREAGENLLAITSVNVSRTRI